VNFNISNNQAKNTLHSYDTSISKWSCKACTFKNPMEISICKICNTLNFDDVNTQQAFKREVKMLNLKSYIDSIYTYLNRKKVKRVIHGSEMKEWICKNCTLFNPINLFFCKACSERHENIEHPLVIDCLTTRKMNEQVISKIKVVKNVNCQYKLDSIPFFLGLKKEIVKTMDATDPFTSAVPKIMKSNDSIKEVIIGLIDSFQGIENSFSFSNLAGAWKFDLTYREKSVSLADRYAREYITAQSCSLATKLFFITKWVQYSSPSDFYILLKNTDASRFLKLDKKTICKTPILLNGFFPIICGDNPKIYLKKLENKDRPAVLIKMRINELNGKKYPLFIEAYSRKEVIFVPLDIQNCIKKFYYNPFEQLFPFLLRIKDFYSNYEAVYPYLTYNSMLADNKVRILSYETIP